MGRSPFLTARCHGNSLFQPLLKNQQTPSQQNSFRSLVAGSCSSSRKNRRKRSPHQSYAPLCTSSRSKQQGPVETHGNQSRSVVLLSSLCFIIQSLALPIIMCFRYSSRRGNGNTRHMLWLGLNGILGNGGLQCIEPWRETIGTKSARKEIPLWTITMFYSRLWITKAAKKPYYAFDFNHIAFDGVPPTIRRFSYQQRLPWTMCRDLMWIKSQTMLNWSWLIRMAKAATSEYENISATAFWPFSSGSPWILEWMDARFLRSLVGSGSRLPPAFTRIPSL